MRVIDRKQLDDRVTWIEEHESQDGSTRITKTAVVRDVREVNRKDSRLRDNERNG